MSSNQRNTATRKLLEGMVVFWAVVASAGLIYQTHNLNRVQQENNTLRQYTTMAQDFAQAIKPDTLDDFVYCTDTNCMTCQAVRSGNKRALRAYNTAIHTLQINRQTLADLQTGPNK